MQSSAVSVMVPPRFAQWLPVSLEITCLLVCMPSKAAWSRHDFLVLLEEQAVPVSCLQFGPDGINGSLVVREIRGLDAFEMRSQSLVVGLSVVLLCGNVRYLSGDCP